MKKSVWVLSAGLLVFVALAVYLPGFFDAAPIEVELVQHGSEGEFRLINHGEGPVFYTGYSPDDCVSLKAVAVDPSVKIPAVIGWCGTGLAEQQVDPGGSAIFTGYFQPETYKSGPVIVSCSVHGGVSDFVRLKNFLVQKFPSLDRFWSVSYPKSTVITTGEVQFSIEDPVAAN